LASSMQPSDLLLTPESFDPGTWVGIFFSDPQAHNNRFNNHYP